MSAAQMQRQRGKCNATLIFESWMASVKSEQAETGTVWFRSQRHALPDEAISNKA
jgi:uncharacterized lipoprotein YbaY